ncbi:MAG: hypothetical protein AB1Z19_05910 [Eubacteriales bacterium]
MKKNGKIVLKAIGLIIITAVVFVGLLMLTNLIPRASLQKNIRASAAQVVELEKADEVIPQFYTQYKMDYYTDSVMLNAAYFTDTDHPLNAAIACCLYGGGTAHLSDVAANPAISPNYAYSRYWHGYLVILRPLLLVFDYIQIGVFNTYLFFLLLFFNLILLYKKIGGWFSAVFLFTIISLNIVVLAVNMQLFTIFAISFVAIPVVLRLYEKRKDWLKYAFLLIGMCTMYFDFYTYPVLTFGLPMIVLLLAQEKVKDTEREPIKQVIVMLAFWTLGYLLTWLIKLGLVYAVLGQAEVQAAGDSLVSRISRAIPAATYEKLVSGLADIAPSLSVDALPLWLISLGLVLKQMLQPVFLIGVGIIIILSLSLLIVRKKVERSGKTVWALLLVAALPLVWYIVAVNPTIIHFYFQYRGIGVTLLGILSTLLISVDFEHHERKKA